MEGGRYWRLGLHEREEISRFLAQGRNFHEIAKAISRHVRTMSREVNWAGMNRYTY
jgi:IS30 family transposase